MSPEELNEYSDLIRRMANSQLKPEVLVEENRCGDVTVTIVIGGRYLHKKTALPEYALPYVSGYLAAMSDCIRNSFRGESQV